MSGKINKTMLILAVAGAFFAGSFLSLGQLVEANPPPRSLCPPENVQHWSWTMVSPVDVVIKHNTFADITTDAKITFPNPFPVNHIDGAGVDQLVVDRLNELGYFIEDPNPRQITSDDVNTGVGTIGFEPFSTICSG